MIEEIKAIGEVISGLGEAGKTAFIVWLVADVLKVVIAYGLSFAGLAVVSKRIGAGLAAMFTPPVNEG